MTISQESQFLVKPTIEQTKPHEKYTPTLQTPEQFLSAFVEHARNAKERIVEQTMYFKSGTKLSDKINEAISEAAKRGVSVIWGVDNYINDFPDTYLRITPKPLR